jgi:hypothetical protein
MKFKTIMLENFKNINQMAAALNSRPVNKVFKGRKDLASQEKTSGYDSFYGSAESFEKALDFLEGGYSEPMERMKKAVLKIDKKEAAPRPKTKTSVVGFQAHVPNAIQGIPESMIMRERQKEKSKTIHLLYGFSAAAKESASSLEQGGVNFISLVNSLEKQGYRVKIDIIKCTTSTETVSGFICNVKEYDQKTNLLKLCFPLVHPSMLRRVGFRQLETQEGLNDYSFNSGYGQTLIVRLGYKSDKERALLSEWGLLGKNKYYCNVYDAMKAKDLNDLAEMMGLVR